MAALWAARLVVLWVAWKVVQRAGHWAAMSVVASVAQRVEHLVAYLVAQKAELRVYLTAAKKVVHSADGMVGR